MIRTNYSLARPERPSAEVVVVRRGRCRISAYSVRVEKGSETPGAASRRCPLLQGPWQNHAAEATEQPHRQPLEGAALRRPRREELVRSVGVMLIAPPLSGPWILWFSPCN